MFLTRIQSVLAVVMVGLALGGIGVGRSEKVQ
jgi:hypothetical protein